jgi:DNA-3-methyladenine glycosylase I
MPDTVKQARVSRGAAPAPGASRRCAWARTPLSIAYHDAEWGVPVHDDRTLFEFLILEGAQAGLSWEVILNKRLAYREAFDQFEPARVARYTPARIATMLGNPGIVRNRLKLESAVLNAQAFLEVQREFGSFDAYVWRFVGGRPRVNRRRGPGRLPAKTAESDALSKDLLSRDFKFVGSTICFSDCARPSTPWRISAQRRRGTRRCWASSPTSTSRSTWASPWAASSWG